MNDTEKRALRETLIKEIVQLELELEDFLQQKEGWERAKRALIKSKQSELAALYDK